MNPLVSVVIPTYNREKYIGQTVESVLNQTYSNFEVIVVDDGSTDGTKKALLKYASRLKYIFQSNSERGASRNKGLKESKGEFIAFLDSDDLWLPEKLNEEISQLLSNASAGVVYSDVDLIDANGNYLKTIKRKGYQGNVTEQLLCDNFISIGGHLIRTKLLRQINGSREERELSGSEDWEMWVRLSRITDFVYLPKSMVKIRTHDSNTMINPDGMNRSMTYALKLMESSDYLSAPQKRLLYKTKAHIQLINAINYCTAHKSGDAVAALKKAFSINPGIVKDPRFAYTVWRLVRNSHT